MERPRKSIWKLGCRIGWKAAGVTLLALVGGSGGCESFREDTPPSLESGPVPRAAAPPAGSPVAADEKATVEGAEEQHAEPGQAGTYKVQRPLAGPTDGLETPAIPAPSGVRSICLPDVLALAGVENPVILLAEQAVQSSLALQMQARVLLLPNLNVGGDFNNHTGPLQTSAGYIRSVDRQSAYLGLGAEAVGGGTVAYPGVWLFAPLGNAYFEPKVASLVVAQRSFEAVATRHNVLLDVAVRYLRLLGAEGRLAVVRQTQADFAEVVRLTQANVDVGLAHPPDVERARTDALLLESDERRVQEEVAVAAADLARLLNLDPSTRLQIAKDPILVVQLIDSHQPLAELLEVARSRRPEMQAVAAEIAAAAARVTQEKTRPFLPTLSVGYSEGGFGGGSNLTSPAFNNLHPRGDFDAMAWWTFQNLGFGNAALVKQRRRSWAKRRAVAVSWSTRLIARSPTPTTSPPRDSGKCRSPSARRRRRWTGSSETWSASAAARGCPSSCSTVPTSCTRRGRNYCGRSSPTTRLSSSSLSLSANRRRWPGEVALLVSRGFASDRTFSSRRLLDVLADLGI